MAARLTLADALGKPNGLMPDFGAAAFNHAKQ